MAGLLNDAYKITKNNAPKVAAGIGGIRVGGISLGNILDAFIPGNIYGADYGDAIFGSN